MPKSGLKLVKRKTIIKSKALKSNVLRYLTRFILSKGVDPLPEHFLYNEHSSRRAVNELRKFLYELPAPKFAIITA